VNGAAPAIEAKGICKSFGETRALIDVDLVADAGRVLALLGPNGAGKTTLVRILTTLLRADAGTATVAGLDVVRDAAQLRRVIGLTGQFAAVDPLLTGRENLEMVGQLCQLSRGEAARRARELLERFGLAGAGDRLARTYSGGMTRRLDLAASLIAEPPVLVLDEPTTGLDPRSKLEVQAFIREVRAAHDATILLCTHDLAEAETLAERIGILDRGELLCLERVDALLRRFEAETLEEAFLAATGRAFEGDEGDDERGLLA
jgi:ABC-type multidrug transport system ATPase subunit